MLSLLTKTIQKCFSLRLKGPTSQRLLMRQGKDKKQPIIEDNFQEYYTSTLNLYKNNFTVEEMEHAGQAVKRVFSLSNATPREILRFRIAQAVKKYQKEFSDHGSAGVQCAVMSERIILQLLHVKKYPKDTKAARYLTQLLDQRRHMLHYLMRTDYHRYEWICTDYGIPIVFPRNAHHVRNFGLRDNTYKVSF